MKLRTKAWLAVFATTGLVIGGMSPALATGPAGPTEHTDMGVTGDAVMAHVRALSDISVKHKDDGFRSLGSPGYAEAVDYVEKTLKATGAYTVTKQELDVESQNYGTVAVSVGGTDLKVIPASYTEATASPLKGLPLVLPVDDAYGDLAGGELGCEAADYDASAQGAVVLVSRGSCSFGQKTQVATDAGAAAVIIYNNTKDAPDEELNATLGARVPNGAPTVTVTYATGSDLSAKAVTAGADDPLPVDFTLETEYVTQKTWNVLAETKAGDHDNVQMFGAHLDGVADGPAANDNGSGSAALLASAQALAKQPTKVDNAVRFGFWAAEEEGLIGSTDYVESLSDAELGKIKAYMNFDMIGSNNYIVGTMDSDGDYTPVPDGITVPKGSVELEKIFTDYFDANDQPYIGTAFDGRSDYQAFMDAGIAVGGLFSGADGTKTDQEAKWFGGTAGETYDTNYHQATDTVENMSAESVGIFAPAIAYSIHTLAYDLVEAPAVERTITITPKTISSKDFVGDKGVTVTVTGCTPDTTATMTVKSKNGKIKSFTQDAKADENGTATFGVRGLDADKAKTYVGRYDVSVECDGGDALTAGFTVTGAKSDPGKKGDTEKPDPKAGGDVTPTAGDELPRTGNDAMPLVLSAGALIALGLAMTMGARRRKN